MTTTTKKMKLLFLRHSRYLATTNIIIMIMVALVAIGDGGGIGVMGFSHHSAFDTKIKTKNNDNYDRRQMLVSITQAVTMSLIFPPTTTMLLPQSVSAREPGSTDLTETVGQIRDASGDLRTLEKNWSEYATINGEGRAGSTDGARRILGGIAPQAGAAAIETAAKTPLYRIDVAFVTVRKAVLSDDGGGEAWTSKLDLDKFEELADRIIYETKKADGNFYSVLFAQKGTKMINDIFDETRNLVRQGILDLDEMATLLDNAGAPGLVK